MREDKFWVVIHLIQAIFFFIIGFYLIQILFLKGRNDDPVISYIFVITAFVAGIYHVIRMLRRKRNK